jgi:CRP/FNR family cyclic AMP-dependent transcriptional regulator
MPGSRHHLAVYPLEIVEHAIEAAANALARPEGQIALGSAALASAFSIAGTFVKTMIPLRWLAVGTNLGFMVYGALYPQLPLMVLHALLLPINLYRAAEMVRLSRRVNAAAQARDTSGLWLRPYMKRLKLKAGTVLFRKGDLADHLYMLASGRVELVEIGVDLPAGRIIGEIAFFAPDRRRTLSARCIEDSEVLAINESTVRQLYYQNPEFGFELIGLVAGRLTADIHRLEDMLDAQRKSDPAATVEAPISSA